jgi:anti-sigma B factor antagonist
MSQPVDPAQQPAAIRLKGELNSLTSAQLREQLQGHLAAGRLRIMVDLAAVTFIDSSGLSALVAGLKSLKLNGGRLALVGLQPQARMIFQITQADTLFAIFDDEPAALAFLDGTEA